MAIFTLTEYGGSDNFGTIFRVVLAAPPPQLSILSTTYGTLNLGWNAISGHSYQVQFTRDLLSGNWSNLYAAMVATNSPPNFTDTISDIQRFYRVVQFPANSLKDDKIDSV